jgi:hypothetical protein
VVRSFLDQYLGDNSRLAITGAAAADARVHIRSRTCSEIELKKQGRLQEIFLSQLEQFLFSENLISLILSHVSSTFAVFSDLVQNSRGGQS